MNQRPKRSDKDKEIDDYNESKEDEKEEKKVPPDSNIYGFRKPGLQTILKKKYKPPPKPKLDMETKFNPNFCDSKEIRKYFSEALENVHRMCGTSGIGPTPITSITEAKEDDIQFYRNLSKVSNQAVHRILKQFVKFDDKGVGSGKLDKRAWEHNVKFFNRTMYDQLAYPEVATLLSDYLPELNKCYMDFHLMPTLRGLYLTITGTNARINILEPYEVDDPKVEYFMHYFGIIFKSLQRCPYIIIYMSYKTAILRSPDGNKEVLYSDINMNDYSDFIGSPDHKVEVLNESHQTAIIVENRKDRIYLYLYNPHGVLNAPVYRFGLFFAGLLNKYYENNKGINVFNASTTIDGGIQTYIRKHDLGYCVAATLLYVYMTLYIALSYRNAYQFVPPIYVWYRCVEKLLFRLYTPEKLTLIVTAFFTTLKHRTAHHINKKLAQREEKSRDLYDETSYLSTQIIKHFIRPEKRRHIEDIAMRIAADVDTVDVHKIAYSGKYKLRLDELLYAKHLAHLIKRQRIADEKERQRRHAKEERKKEINRKFKKELDIMKKHQKMRSKRTQYKRFHPYFPKRR